MENKPLQQGAIITFVAYLLWGIFPIYWKFLDNVPAGEVLAHRIVWSLVFMIFLVLATGNWRHLMETVQLLKKDRKKALAIITASIVISINWFLFIFFCTARACAAGQLRILYQSSDQYFIGGLCIEGKDNQRTSSVLYSRWYRRTLFNFKLWRVSLDFSIISDEFWFLRTH